MSLHFIKLHKYPVYQTEEITGAYCASPASVCSQMYGNRQHAALLQQQSSYIKQHFLSPNYFVSKKKTKHKTKKGKKSYYRHGKKLSSSSACTFAGSLFLISQLRTARFKKNTDTTKGTLSPGVSFFLVFNGEPFLSVAKPFSQHACANLLLHNVVKQQSPS